MKNKLYIILSILLFLSININAQKVEKYELKSINFEGNEEYSSSVLDYVIYSQESPMWFWKFIHSITGFSRGASYFDSTNVQKDIDALKGYYFSNGFFKVNVTSKTEIDTSSKSVNLTYYINENQPSHYGYIKIIGINNLAPDIKSSIRNDIIVDSTKIYSQGLLSNNIDRAFSTLLNTGYMFASFDSTLIYLDTLKNKANINVYFTTGKRYTIDSVLIEKSGVGADVVENKLLKKISGFKPGDYYDLEKIRLNQIRLFRTGLFNTVSLSGVKKDTSGNHVPLILQGNIGLMNELSPEIIINNQQNAFNLGLGATYIRRNFFGEARKMTISTSFGIQDIFQVDFREIFKKFSFRDTTFLGYVDARVKFEQPYLFGKNIFGTWENYATINKQKAYNNTIYGTKLNFEFELPRYTLINFLSIFYRIEQSNEIYRTYNDSLSIKTISSVGVNFGSTTIDSLLFPTKGYNLSFQLEEANSIPYLVTKIRGNKYGGALFYKILITNSMYFNLSHKRNSILAFKVKTGYVQPFVGDYSGIPINKTFYAGGSNSIRGWRANELVPKGTPILRAGIRRGPNVKGGTFLLETSLEYRYRFLNNYGIVFFTDVGNTWLGYKQFRWDDTAVAVGIGFRYYTLIAPFRIDLGFKFYDPNDRRFIFDKKVWSNFVIQFGIGEAF
ncbi:MAG: BamA/TamA family outer membrane protein [Chlorobi bacterium]|nr:BamA/TamA family outer membrane protein [Chlorobiota bacterium]